MSDSLYKKNIIEHYRDPRNFFKMEGFDKSFKLSNISCGDEIEVFVKLKDNLIEDISFQGSGCAISIASTSMLTEKFKGKDVNSIRDLKKNDVLDMLGMGEETPRVKCALLGLEVLRKFLD